MIKNILRKTLVYLIPSLLMAVPLQYAEAEIGDIETYAGTGVRGYNGDNISAVTAKLSNPKGVTIDHQGNIYLADESNHRIRKIDPLGNITTVAGTGISGPLGNGGLAVNAQLSYPSDITVDSKGNLYIADQGNSQVRKVDIQTGLIANLAFVTSVRAIAVDKNDNIYASKFPAIVVKISPNGTVATVAGTNSSGFSGDGGPATSAQLNNPHGLALDSIGNLYIADTLNKRVRKVDILNGSITTVAGGGASLQDNIPATEASLSFSFDIAFDQADNLYITDTFAHRIRKVDAVTGIITTIAGTGKAGYSGDGGPAVLAQLAWPMGATANKNNDLFISDTSNNRLRKVEGEPPPIIPSFSWTIDLALMPETLNLESAGNYITARLEVTGDKIASDIEPLSLKISHIDDHALGSPLSVVQKTEGKSKKMKLKVSLGDEDENGIQDLTAKFDRASLAALLPVSEEVRITIEGNFKNGDTFSAQDSIRTLQKNIILVEAQPESPTPPETISEENSDPKPEVGSVKKTDKQDKEEKKEPKKNPQEKKLELDLPLPPKEKIKKDPPQEPPQKLVQKDIPPQKKDSGPIDHRGGQLKNKDTGVEIRVPQGALKKEIQISVKKSNILIHKEIARRQKAAEKKGFIPIHAGFEFGPEGTTFDKPITIVLPYDPDLLPPGTDEISLRVGYWNPKTEEWEEQKASIDTGNNLISIRVSHFSLYSILAPLEASQPVNPSFGFDEVYAYPNPAKNGKNPILHIEAGVAQEIDIRFYDISGDAVHSANIDGGSVQIIDDGQGPQYAYEYTWDVSNVASGVYIYVVEARKGPERLKYMSKVAVIK